MSRQTKEGPEGQGLLEVAIGMAEENAKQTDPQWN